MWNDFEYRPAPASAFLPMQAVGAPPIGEDWDTPPLPSPVPSPPVLSPRQGRQDVEAASPSQRAPLPSSHRLGEGRAAPARLALAA